MNDTIVKTQLRQLNKSISDSSLSVILRNPKTEVELTESPEEIVITSFFNIVISKKPFGVNYYRSQELLLSEKEVDTSNVLYRRRREH
jgi:hypothetical protein